MCFYFVKLQFFMLALLYFLGLVMSFSVVIVSCPMWEDEFPLRSFVQRRHNNRNGGENNINYYTM